jgi:hypothetical protein
MNHNTMMQNFISSVKIETNDNLRSSRWTHHVATEYLFNTIELSVARLQLITVHQML